MSALSVFHQLKILTALCIWAGFRTILKKQLVEHQFSPFVSLIDILDLSSIDQVIENVKSIENAPFERVVSFFALKAECEIAVLTSSQILVSFKSGKGSTAVEGTPP